MDEKQPDLFGEDPEGAKRARDAALARVADNSGPWFERTLLKISLLKGFEGITEDLKLRLLREGWPPPHHFNVWGSLTKEAVKQGILIPTGKMRYTTTLAAKHRPEKVYRSRG